MQHCQPLVLIFQFLKSLNKELRPPLSLKPGPIPEYMSNGSLANFLFGISRPHWNQRVQIAFGIARGLMY